MRVGIKKILAGAAGFVGMMALADVAAAGCNTGCQPPQPPPPPVTPCCLPPPPPVRPPVIPPVPPVPPRDGVNGWGGGGNVNVNVNVNVAGARAFAGARAGATVIVGGGGGAYFNVDQPYPTTIQGLSVEGKTMEMVRVPYTASRRMEKRVVIQAVCIDDRAVPHPASQVRPGKDVAADYEGELYRCIAGTRLQYTLAEFAEQISFDHGQTMSCRKGESLWYQEGGSGGASEYAAQYAAAYAAQYGGEQGPGGPIGGGIVECRPQTPERDCNERSLLRRYGAGIKILTLWREEMYTEYEQEVVQAASSMSMGSSLTLDGGVGGRVF